MNTCPRCGKPLEVTQVVQGRVHTHPCACRCMIEQFERDRARAERSTDEIHRVWQTGGESEATDGERPRLHAGKDQEL